MGLDLVLGPANAGKVGLLLERYLDELDAGGDALLVVPTADAVRRAERDLLRRRPVLLGGAIVAFDSVFGRVLRNTGDGVRVLAPGERRILLTRLLRRSPHAAALGEAARGPRFADVLATLVDRLGAGLVDPPAFTAASGGSPTGRALAGLYAAWWSMLDEVAVWDLPRMRLEACRRLERSLAAWGSTRLFVQGFEDLSRAQEALVRAVAARAGVTMTLPYEVARPAFAALRPTVERLAPGARIEERPPLAGARPPVLARLERFLYADAPAPGPSASEAGAVTVVEAAGARAEADAIGDLVAAAIREGTPPERILIVVPREPAEHPDLTDVLAEVGVPAHVEARERLAATPLGRALDRLLAVAWDEAFTREDLFEYLRSPWSGLARRRVDFAEGRLRARGVREGPDAYAQTIEVLGHPLAVVDHLRTADAPLTAVRETVRRLVGALHGVEAPAPSLALHDDLRVAQAATAALDGLAALPGDPPSRGEVREALARTRLGPRTTPAGRVRVCSPVAARGLDVDLVVVVGLESSGFGAAPADDALLGEEQRERLGAALGGAEPGDLERHRLYTVVTRAARRLVLVRRFASEDGRVLEPSPLLDDLGRALGGLPTAVRRRLSDVTVPVEEAPSVRARLRAVCALAARDPEEGGRAAEAAGATRRLRRAEAAFERRTVLRDPAHLAALAARDRFQATALERFGDCSSWWFVERMLDPKEIDGVIDARAIGSAAHVALHRFYRALPGALGKERLEPGDGDRADALMRSLVPDALAGQNLPLESLDGRLLERRLLRDLSAFVRREAEHPSPLAATRLEVSFGGASSPPGLKDGLRIDDFFVSGKIDRIDTDPAFSARGLVQDYKSGRTAWTASRIRDEGRLQIPLYILATRELLGIEPMGGLYRSLAPGGPTRGMLDAAQGDALPPGLARNDLLDSEEFWRRVDEARTTATRTVARMRRGDVRHDPRGGSCASYCPCATVCRVTTR